MNMPNKEAMGSFVREPTPRISKTTVLSSFMALAMLPGCVSQPKFSEPVGSLGISVTCSKGDLFPQGVAKDHIDIDLHSIVLDPRPTNHPDEGIFIFLTDLASGTEARQIDYEGNSPTVRGSFHGQTTGTEFISGKALRFEARLAKQSTLNPKTNGEYLVGQTVVPDCPNGNHIITVS